MNDHHHTMICRLTKSINYYTWADCRVSQFPNCYTSLLITILSLPQFSQSKDNFWSPVSRSFLVCISSSFLRCLYCSRTHCLHALLSQRHYFVCIFIPNCIALVFPFIACDTRRHHDLIMIYCIGNTILFVKVFALYRFLNKLKDLFIIWDKGFN